MKQPESSPAFSLTEILAATAILSVMFAIMFGILQQTSRGWQAANRKVEASQVARMALEQISTDLESAVAVMATNLPLPNGTRANYAFGFAHSNNATGTFSTNASRASPNDQIFVVTPDPASSSQGEADLGEAGYIPARALQTVSNLKQGRYYLIRHWVIPGNAGYDFLANSTNWENTPASIAGTSRRQAFVDNCLRFDILFLYSPTNNLNQVLTSETWGRPQTNGTWTNHPPGAPLSLPRAAEITLCVLDERSAERLARIEPNGLSAEELGKIPDQLDQITSEPVKATLREGLTTFRRRVTFRNGQP